MTLAIATVILIFDAALTFILPILIIDINDNMSNMGSIFLQHALVNKPTIHTLLYGLANATTPCPLTHILSGKNKCVI
jgi:hypothetical protein